MLRPTSLCSLVAAVSAVAVASGTSVWQPGDGQAILAHAAGLHLMDGHLARWFSTVGDRIQHDSTPKPTSTTNTNRDRQATPYAPVDIVFRYMNGDAGGYATTFYIGTPPQPVTFGLDLTSADVMVLNHKIDGHRYYDHAKSSTYKPNGTHFNYGEYLRGYMSGDDISLGDPDKHAFKLHDQLFLELTGKDEILSMLPTDGSLGFGIRHSVFVPGTPPPIRTLIDNGQLEEPVIGLYVAEHDAHAMIGGIDSMYTQGPVTYFPVDQTDLRWSVLFDSIAVGGKPVAGAHGRALIYTALAAIVGPKAQVEAIAEAVGVQEGWIPCNATTPNVTIQVTKDIKVTLTKEDYSVPTKYDNVCMFTILSSPMFHGWGFGAPFLRKVYTVLDFGKSNADARTGIAALHGIGPQE